MRLLSNVLLIFVVADLIVGLETDDDKEIWRVNPPNKTGPEEQFRVKRSVKTSTVLTASQQQAAVNKHNELRRIVSPTASNMLKMEWDPKLAKIAQDYSRRCIYAHNSGRTSNKFTWVGENLYIRSNELEATRVLQDAITSWDGEKSLYTYSTKACSGVCGHYTQTAWAESYAVGCGVTTCSNINVGSNTWSTGQLVVCNYGPGGNVNNKSPYLSGATCSACPTGYWCSDRLCTNSSGRKATYAQLTIIISLIIVMLHGVYLCHQ